ncbi:hypothetical protein TNCV_4021231 [Trichonephila clavipes]|nr:hypothetical protein TNCV_4021231 [Trichonephila clavipes]
MKRSIRNALENRVVYTTAGRNRSRASLEGVQLPARKWRGEEIRVSQSRNGCRSSCLQKQKLVMFDMLDLPMMASFVVYCEKVSIFHGNFSYASERN